MPAVRYPQLDPKKLGQKIAALSAEYGYTIQELADRLGLSPSTVKSYLYGRRKPSYETLKLMSELFHQPTIDSMIDWE